MLAFSSCKCGHKPQRFAWKPVAEPVSKHTQSAAAYDTQSAAVHC